LSFIFVLRRYEEGPTPATQEDADDAALMAVETLNWAKGICKESFWLE
jgi:hypothetical protein